MSKGSPKSVSSEGLKNAERLRSCLGVQVLLQSWAPRSIMRSFSPDWTPWIYQAALGEPDRRRYTLRCTVIIVLP